MALRTSGLGLETAASPVNGVGLQSGPPGGGVRWRWGRMSPQRPQVLVQRRLSADARCGSTVECRISPALTAVLSSHRGVHVPPATSTRDLGLGRRHSRGTWCTANGPTQPPCSTQRGVSRRADGVRAPGLGWPGRICREWRLLTRKTLKCAEDAAILATRSAVRRLLRPSSAPSA